MQKRVELIFYLCYFLLEITALKFMKSRQISGIHFFSVLLQLQWLYIIGTPFLNSQCSNRSVALLDLIYIQLQSFLHKYGELMWVQIYLFCVIFELISSQ